METAVQDKDLEIAASVLGREMDILFATVFGSVASGRAQTDSDLDVAILATGPLSSERRQALIETLACALGRPVDLVDLRSAGVVVAREALRGRRLFCRDNGAYAELLSRLVTDTEDFLPYRRRLLEERRNAWLR